jgi:hypothetical protein
VACGLALLLALGAGGCGGGNRGVVTGKVTYHGRPVTEGTIQFIEARTGHGAEVELGPDGSYQATLPPGSYNVVVLPPLVVVEMKRMDTPPDTVYKKVANIPAKYHSTATSGLTAVVGDDQTSHDFDLK